MRNQKKKIITKPKNNNNKYNQIFPIYIKRNFRKIKFVFSVRAGQKIKKIMDYFMGLQNLRVKTYLFMSIVL